MPTTFLDVPVGASEGSERGFNHLIAEALIGAYGLIKHHEYAPVEPVLAPLLALPMSKRQFVRIRYALGLAAARLRELDVAYHLIDEAMEHVADFDDPGACGILASLQGSTQYFRNHFRSAAVHFHIALDAWHASPGAPGPMTPHDLAFEVDVLTNWGTQLFWLGQAKHATQLFQRARRLGTQLPDAERHLARLEWMLALSYRWRGQHEQALRHGIAALEVYQRRGSPTEIARLQTVLADLVIDQAAAFTSDTAATVYSQTLAMAEPYLLHALAQTRVVGDQPGEGMATLAYVRYLRATKNTEVDRVAFIDAVERLAERLSDQALLGQALTARGGELATYDGGEEASSQAYHSALAVLEHGGALGLGIWARRALHLRRENTADREEEEGWAVDGE